MQYIPMRTGHPKTARLINFAAHPNMAAAIRFAACVVIRLEFSVDRELSPLSIAVRIAALKAFAI